MCRRAIPVQLSQPGHTDTQVGSAWFMIHIVFYNITECHSAVAFLCMKAHAWAYEPGDPDNPQQPHHL